MAKRTGKFIVIDGSDGTGKATQLALLRKYFEKNGDACEVIAFPQYGKKSAGLVEEYLAGTYGMTDPYTSSVFYAVDRYDASFKIRKWLEDGKTVLSDRFVTASAGHQGGKLKLKSDRTKYFAWLDEFEFGIMNLPRPDLTIILSIPYKISVQLINSRAAKGEGKMMKRGKDLHERDPNHLKRAVETFAEIGEFFTNTQLVNCVENGKLLTPEQVHEKVKASVKKLTSKKPNAKKSK